MEGTIDEPGGNTHQQYAEHTGDGAIGAELQASGLVKVSVAGPELVLIDTDDFTKPEYKAYAAMLRQFLK